MKSDLLPLKLRIKFYAYKYGLYAFILFMIFAFAFLLDKHIEAIFLFVSFVFIRYKFPKTFHHNNTYWCVFWSILSFWLCIATTIPLGYSILSGVCVALLLCFILYKVQDYNDLKHKKPKTIYELTYDEFISLCLSNGVRNERAVYAWDLIRSTMSVKELAEKYFVEEQTIKQDRWRFKKKLSKSVDNNIK